MILTYWISHIEDDHKCYSIRRRTRKEVLGELARMDSKSRSKFSEPLKITVGYKNAFDLLHQAYSEGGIDEHNFYAEWSKSEEVSCKEQAPAA